MRSKYNTKQKEEILKCLRQNKGKHITVCDINKYFKEQNITVGTTTIYRQLDRMVEDGIVKKYILEGIGSCFEYLDNSDEYHYYLKCEKCSKLIPFNCKHLQEVQDHLSKEHGFIIDAPKTIFYGICATCSRGEQ